VKTRKKKMIMSRKANAIYVLSFSTSFFPFALFFRRTNFVVGFSALHVEIPAEMPKQLACLIASQPVGINAKHRCKME